ncbi:MULTISPECIES: DUF2959 domain-containing protein [Gammaproteobacteria]|uniref:DUF2959 domain-containing protein n=1 Tax=Gammaproteobacteria TaxID=1236 RepID=UPI000DD0C7DA|nr:MULTISPECIES: DUF2959 domain-containing protein [Gammaproteobacteria]RTE86692.1 DUF2959 domain-containing protein [Aliidiomarina sp. B3213]TCZ90754.1 DUF2959 domain-containing protein [Lysobacter sp. N42]
MKALVTLVMSLFLFGCTTVYYDTMEKFGIEKRDILVDRVGNARDAQNEAQETFRSALEQFQTVVGTPETELSRTYSRLNNAFEDSEKAAEDVTDRINDVERVAHDLFEEWEDELNQYENANYRRMSEQQMRETQRQYDSLISRMRQAESRMAPVLSAFRDQVLFLKHNLNAQAIGALEGELGRIQSDVATLIENMEASIAESEAFIARFQQAN